MLTGTHKHFRSGDKFFSQKFKDYITVTKIFDNREWYFNYKGIEYKASVSLDYLQKLNDKRNKLFLMFMQLKNKKK